MARVRLPSKTRCTIRLAKRSIHERSELSYVLNYKYPGIAEPRYLASRDRVNQSRISVLTRLISFSPHELGGPSVTRSSLIVHVFLLSAEADQSRLCLSLFLKKERKKWGVCGQKGSPVSHHQSIRFASSWRRGRGISLVRRSARFVLPLSQAMRTIPAAMASRVRW